MKQQNKLVSVIIPAYNEADIIEETLNNLKFEWIKEIIVINDGSTDKTLKQIRRFKDKKNQLKVINFKFNSGKGLAVEKGLLATTGDIILMVDADLGKSVELLEKLVLPVMDDKADMTIGVLPLKGGGLGLVRRLAVAGLRFTTGKVMRAPLSGQRAFNRKCLYHLLPLSRGFGLEIGMDIEILRNNLRIEEIECNLEHRVTGRTIKGFVHRGNQFYDILKTLWQKRRYV